MTGDDLDFDALERAYAAKQISAKGKADPHPDDLDFDVLEKAYAAREAAKKPQFLDVGAATRAVASGQSAPPPLAGDTPRAYNEGSPLGRGIALDASIASGQHAETAEHKATRELNAAKAGAEDTIPFYPRIRGGIAAGLAGLHGQPMGPAFDAKFAETDKRIEQEKAGSPVYAAMGSVPLMLAAPGGIPAKTMGGRILGGSVLGATYGASAVDRPGVTAGEILAGGTAGAGVGALGATIAEAFRPVIRGAPTREDKQFAKEIVRTEGGEGSMGLRASNKEGIAKDFEDVIAQRHDPAIREAVKMTEGKGIPTINAKIRPLAEDNAKLYPQIEQGLATGPNHPGLMTQDRLNILLDDAKKNVSAEGALRIDGIKHDLNSHVVPRTWNGEQVIPPKRLREWLTTIQDSASRVPGQLNATAAAKSVGEATREAARIFNEHLDSAGMPEIAARIRANNEPISALSRIRDAMAVKAGKEKLQSMGLGSILEEQQQKMERTAALWAAMEGHPIAAAAIALKDPAEKAIARTAKWANRELLEPLQLAAERGDSRAQLIRYSVERGVPYALADEMAKKAGEAAASMARQKPAPAQPLSPVGRMLSGSPQNTFAPYTGDPNPSWLKELRGMARPEPAR